MRTGTLYELLTRFFSEHLQQHRNVSRNTIAAYADTFRLLLRFLNRTRRIKSATLELGILTPDRVLAFLQYLESNRGNSSRSRNARLAAIRSFIRYAQDLVGPELPEKVGRILAIPRKRHTQPVLGFLTRDEIDSILAATSPTWSGQRDHLLFLLLYNTGARVSEVLSLHVRDVLAADGAHLILHGKGRKERTIPLWRSTQHRLRQWIRQNRLASEAPLLPNRFGHPMTRSGVAWQLRQLVRKAAAQTPSLRGRRISPHTFRHSTAMHLLQGGVATEVIALWLGHERPNTTHHYVEADLQMKSKALEALRTPKGKRRPQTQHDELLRFLESL